MMHEQAPRENKASGVDTIAGVPMRGYRVRYLLLRRSVHILKVDRINLNDLSS